MMTPKERQDALTAQRDKLLTVKEYAYVTRQHPMTIYRRIWDGRQIGVHRVGGGVRLDPPDDK